MNDELLIRLFKRHYVDPVAALHRLHGYLASVELPFNLKTQLRELRFPAQPKLPNGLPPLVYYFVPNSRRGTDQPLQDDPLHPSFVNACDGLGLNFGCPVRLLRALDVLARLPLQDQQQPRVGLRNAPEHLSAVEELLWLNCWKTQTSLRRGGQFAGMAGDVDWAFEVGAVPVFLEAKFRRSDWPRLSDADTFTQLGDGFLSSAIHKFPHPPHGAVLHVVGITTFANIDENIMRVIGRELEAAPQIHAVVIRSLIQMTHIISLNLKVRNSVRRMLSIPAINDYPINHGVFFDRQERDERVACNLPKLSGVNSVKAFSWSIAPTGIVPFPMPDSEAYRFDIPSRGPDGEPHFKVIPKYLRNSVPPLDYKPTLNYAAGMAALADQNLQKALTILSAEPIDSPSYGLAMSNKALVELRLDRYAASEATGKLAISHFDRNGCPQLPTWVQAFRVLGDSIYVQDRINESFKFFIDGCHLANHLIERFPDLAEDICLQKAHTLNSWGGALIHNRDPASAIGRFAEARDIYRKYPNNKVGWVETLTNLALAYEEIGNETYASLAIREAMDLVGSDKEQRHRINMVAARLGLFSNEEARRLLLEAARDAELAGNFEKAYVRHCSAGFLAGQVHDPIWGMEVVRLAEALEGKLSPNCLHPAKLSFYKATFLEDSGCPVAELLDVLLVGAKVWCERLPGPLVELEDYQSAVSLMHDHFRKLSALLLQEGRIEEAFVAFETGRARSFAMEITGNRQTFLAENPFRGSAVQQSLLTRVQAGLKSNEIFISIAVLPPNLVAFVVGRDGLEVRVVGLVANMPEADTFWKTISAIPTNLENGRGQDSFPPQVLEIGKMIAEVIGTRKLAVLAPHALLHKVPWRTILHTFGVAWPQLTFVTQFSPILDPDNPTPDVSLPSTGMALGFGVAGSGQNAINLEDEAKDFADSFSNGRVCLGATSHSVTAALNGNDIVLLSCHGEMAPPDQGHKFLFLLADGKFAANELVDSTVKAPLVILSACSSGAYEMAVGDYPIGTAPLLLVAGAQFCICTRYPISAHFAKNFFPSLGRRLSFGQNVGDAFTSTMQEMEEAGYNQWTHLACVELLGRGTERPKNLNQ